LTGTPVLVRTDPGVNFAWGTAGPGAPLPGSGYSVRWSGDLEAAFTETYTIFVYADDGVKLWFNGELVVDKWFGQESGRYV
jgi:mannan endo-1,4-beta-mannosidase